MGRHRSQHSSVPNSVKYVALGDIFNEDEGCQAAGKGGIS